MKNIIQKFLDSDQLAVAGASNKKDNFGLFIMKELVKKGYRVHPVNPGCQEIDGVPCLPTVRELPEEVKGLILAVPPALTEEIAAQCAGTHIERVWMIRGVGNGAYSEKAHELFKQNNIEVVYGFCPMMFFGKGMHRMHFWFRSKFGKVPAEYLLS